MRKILVAAVALSSAAIAAPAFSAVVSFDLAGTVEGTSPSGFPSATFTDTGTNEVSLRLDLAGLSGGEFASAFFFNFNGDATGLTFSRTDGTGPSEGITIDTGSNAFDSPGNQGLFDIFLGFTTSNSQGGALRFGADEFLAFSITGEGLTASLFNLVSAPQQGTSNFALARIQGIDGGGSASVADEDGDTGGEQPGGEEPGGGGEEPNEIPVPEPAALGLFGLGLIGIGFVRRRKA